MQLYSTVSVKQNDLKLFFLQHSFSIKRPGWQTSSPAESGEVNCESAFFCVLRQVVCAAAGCVGAQRGDWCDSSQQPTEWCPHLGLGVLDLPVAGPARNAGRLDLYANSRCYGARQVKWCESTKVASGLPRTCIMNLLSHIKKKKECPFQFKSFHWQFGLWDTLVKVKFTQGLS